MNFIDIFLQSPLRNTLFFAALAGCFIVATLLFVAYLADKKQHGRSHKGVLVILALLMAGFIIYAWCPFLKEDREDLKAFEKKPKTPEIQNIR